MLVSIIVANFNNARYLPVCLDSVRCQTYQNYELIVVDDCSSDESREIIDSYEERFDGRLRKFYGNRNCGAASARNLALAQAKGELIAVLDSDDVFLPTKIQLQVHKFIEDDRLELCGTGSLIVDATGNKVAGPYVYPSRNLQLKSNLWNFKRFPAHSSMMYRRSSALSLGGYDERFVPAEDFDLMLKLSKIGNVTSLTEPLLHYRIHGNNISHKLYNGYTQNHYALASRIINDDRFFASDQKVALSEILEKIDVKKIEETDNAKAFLKKSCSYIFQPSTGVSISTFLAACKSLLLTPNTARMEQVNRVISEILK